LLGIGTKWVVELNSVRYRGYPTVAVLRKELGCWWWKHVVRERPERHGVDALPGVGHHVVAVHARTAHRAEVVVDPSRHRYGADAVDFEARSSVTLKAGLIGATA